MLIRVNLKEARAVEQQVNTAYREMQVKQTIRADAYLHDIWVINDIKVLREQHAKQADDQIGTKAALIELKYQIRKQIAIVNEKVGITYLVAKLAELEELQRMYLDLEIRQDLTPEQVVAQDETLVRKVNFSREKESLYRDDTITISIDLDLIERIKSTRKTVEKSIRQVKDQITALNLTTEIDLDIPETLTEMLNLN